MSPRRLSIKQEDDLVIYFIYNYYITTPYFPWVRFMLERVTHKNS